MEFSLFIFWYLWQGWAIDLCLWVELVYYESIFEVYWDIVVLALFADIQESSQNISNQLLFYYLPI